MLGAIVGDVVGSVHEWSATKTKDFPLLVKDSTFTDDSVLTVAVAEWLLDGGSLVDLFHDYVRRNPGRGYGSMFGEWARARSREPYHSYGNGSAMRVSPVGFAAETLDEALEGARRSAEVTHDHPEGIRGAQATAAVVFLARKQETRESIRRSIEARFGYDLGFTLDEIRPTYRFNETCLGTVPQAIVAFLESTDFEDALRNAVSLGGDADTLACIVGGMAEAYYGGVPPRLAARVQPRLAGLAIDVVERFRDRHGLP